MHRLLLFSALCPLALVTGGCASSSAQSPPASPSVTAAPVATAAHIWGHLNEPEPQIKVPANIPPEQQGRWILHHMQAERAAKIHGAMVANVPQMVGIMRGLEKVGQYDQMITVAAHNAPLASANAQIPLLKGRAHYFNGDFASASVSWKRALTLDPALSSQVTPLERQMARIVAAFPTFRLKPVVVVPSDVTQHGVAIWKRSLALRNARRYDDIDRACAELQAAGSTEVNGRSEAMNFCDDLGRVDWPNTSLMRPAQAKQLQEAAWQKTHAELEQWVKARPNSKWARLALFRCLVDRAWDLRGDDYAGKVSPEEWQRVNAALSESVGVAAQLPASVQATPFFWATTLDFSQLAGVPFEQFAAQYQEAARRFPHERTLDFGMATMLLPQWSGGPGAWQNWVAKRADEIGGEEGDIAYGQMALHMSDYFEDAEFWKQSGLDWPRARRGFTAQLRQHPTSVATATWLLLNARLNHDRKTATAMILRLNNRANAAKWDTPAEFARLRLEVLDPASAG